jgi:O-antigen/teichoic acid export membrane protein
MKIYPFSKLSNISERSKTIINNVGLSVVIKGISVFLTFVLIPLYLRAVDQREYSIILTITSIVTWISFFDIGIGNGLRNKLGKAISENDRIAARKYLSTGYVYVVLIFLLIFLIYLIFSPFINWHSILKIHPDEIPRLNFYVTVVVGLFIGRFIFQLIGVVLLADQKSYLNDSILLFANLLIILIYYLLKVLHELNFQTLLLLICMAPVVVLIIYSTIFYNTTYKWLKPSVKYFDKTLRNDLLGMGSKFFVIQLIGLIIFSTTNILIARLFDITLVTKYNIAFKYYNITVMIFTILLTPVWGGFTHAWYQHDIPWISASIKKYLYITGLLLLLNILQFSLYGFVSQIWLGMKFPIEGLLAFSFIAYNFIFCYNNIFAYFLNSIGKISVQLYCAVVGGLFNIPLTIYLAHHTHLSLSAIVFANILSLLPSTVFTTIHAYQLLKQQRILLKANNSRP